MRYFYTAKSTKGEERSGILEAKDKHQLARTLRKQGLILVRAELGEKSGLAKIWPVSMPFLSKVSLKEKLFFTRNLQVMIVSGLALPRSLNILASQSKNKIFKKTLLDIREEITRGRSFSEALNNYPGIFSELFRGMIKAGEEVGRLEEVLKILTRQMEKEADLKAKIKGAMIYPAVIICAMLGIGILMLIMVVPRLAETFEELGIELPLTTRMVIVVSTFILEKWYLFLIIIIFVVLLFWRALKTEKGKKIINGLVLKIPVISPIVRQVNSAYTARTLSSLISSGVPLVRSLEITANVLSNAYYKRVLVRAAESVQKGGKLSESLALHQDIYPLSVSQMIEVGEETGQTSDILAKLADFYEEEASNVTENLASAMEPILMLIVGAAVGFFAISMIQPMYGMLGAI